MCVKVNEDPKNFNEFLQLTDKRDEFAIFLSVFLNDGFNPAPLVSSNITLVLF